MNIELRHHTWYATLLVPKDVREALGVVRFKRSLGTPNRRDALLKAAPFIAQWKAEIAQARGTTGAVRTEAMRWRDALKAIDDDDTRADVEGVLIDRLEAMEDKKGAKAAKEFYEIATGARTPASEYFDAWKGQIDLAEKTKDHMVKGVGLLVARFESLEGITKGAVKLWLDEMTKEGKGAASLERILSFCRNYWRYLKTYDAVPAESEPFTGVLVLSKRKKAKAGKTANMPYGAEQVVKLWTEAATRPYEGRDGDKQLADLIMLGAYSGALIEELCSLKAIEVTDKSFKIADSKTAAGIREVPIHPKLAATVKRLVKESKDGFLLSGLTLNKYGDRSNAIGKRFGRLKKAMGFSEGHTFHSMRSTVITQMENAGVSENLAADIVGHDKLRITYGLYSGGAGLKSKTDALAKVAYPF
ncbi:MAG: tyrosine-type recombinase/integrase [Burkholderiales bacterium]|nr:tyrosine-type recombinase/integrase [Burkholderiales bacterium]